jgi:hypothetical protein
MTTQGDGEYFARRFEAERRMAKEARDGASRQLHVRMASEYARRAGIGAKKDNVGQAKS